MSGNSEHTHMLDHILAFFYDTEKSVTACSPPTRKSVILRFGSIMVQIFGNYFVESKVC